MNPRLTNLFLALRPKQWTKNLVVLAPLLFALGDRHQMVQTADIWIACAAALLFCAVSSGIYLFNDIKDLDSDRLHPAKKLRPLASGALPVAQAYTASFSLLATGLIGSCFLPRSFLLVIAGYILLQITYTLFLKRVALIDSMIIASGFVLRAMAGALAVNVFVSPWLLLCAFLLALFLALCKRRHEKITLAETGGDTRSSLNQYDAQLLDLLIAIVSSATIVSYALYTLWPDTVEKFGTNRLGLTIPFVIFGLFRYLDLVYRHDKGDQPEQILLTDIPLVIDLLLYGAAVFAILFFQHAA